MEQYAQVCRMKQLVRPVIKTINYVPFTKKMHLVEISDKNASKSNSNIILAFPLYVTQNFSRVYRD